MLYQTAQALLNLPDAQVVDTNIVTRLFTNVHNNNELQNNIEIELEQSRETSTVLQQVIEEKENTKELTTPTTESLQDKNGFTNSFIQLVQKIIKKILLLKTVLPALQKTEVFDLNVKQQVEEAIQEAEKTNSKSAERAQILEEISKTAETPIGEGLWESYDGGETWNRAQGIGNFAVYSIIFHPTNQQIVYASALGEGVYKSTDRGKHFKSLGDERLKYTYRLVMSPSDSDVLVTSSNLFFVQLLPQDELSGKYGGIFQSKDDGVTWKDLITGIRNYEGDGENFLGWLYNFGHMPNYENILIDPKNPDHLVVGHHGENVVETIDGGASWKKAGAGEMVPGGVHNYAYCLGASSSFKKFYACTCGRGLFRGIMNDRGYISLSLTGNVVYADKTETHTPPRNVAEAREFLLSGEYNHQH